MDARSTIGSAESAASRVTDVLNRHPAVVLTAAVALIAVATISSSMAKPLWHDEIYTVLLARLSVADLWTATKAGVDASPPLNTLLTHAAASVAGTGSVTLRLPPLLGFWIAAAIVFEYVRRRSNTPIALAASVLPCFTAGFRFAYEARGYGVMMGLASVVLFAWSEAAAGRRRRVYLPVLAIALSAGYWNHYFAVFAAAPVMAGEIVRTVRHRKVDAGVWAAIAVSLCAFLPLLSLLQAAAAQAPTFWRKAALSDVPLAYAFLFGSLLSPPVVLAAGFGIIVAGVVRALRVRAGVKVAVPAQERAALALCVALPAVQVMGALATTGVFVPRYALVAVPGFCIAAALVVGRLTCVSRLAQLIWAATLVSTLVATLPIRSAPVNPIRQRPALMRLLAQGEPVAVTGGLMYLQLWYYSPPAMGDRLVFLADPEAALAYTGSDTIDRGLLGLAQWSRLRVTARSGFTEGRPDFRVYAAGPGWLLHWLRDNGASVTEEGTELGAPILHVRLAQ